MISRSNLKESFSVDSKNGAFYSGGKVKWSSDGSTLFCPCLGAVNVVDIASGRPKLVLGDQSEGADIIYSFTVTADGSKVISSHKSGLFKNWELPDGNLLKQWKSIHNGPVAALDISEDGNLLVSGGSDSVVRVWDLVHHACTHALRGASGVISVVKIHELENKTVIFGCGDDLKITCWDLESNKMIFQLSGHYSKITAISFCHDGRHMASSARDNVIMLWDLVTKTCTKTYPVFENLDDVVCLPKKIELPGTGSVGGNIYVATGGEKGIIRIFDMTVGKELYAQTNSLVTQASEKGGLAITQLLYNALENSFAVVTVDHHIIFHKLDTFECTKQLVGFSDEILDIVFVGPENSHVAIATNSRDIKLFNVKNLDCQLLKGHTDLVLTLTSSLANSTWMLSGAKDNSVMLWELNLTTQKMICLAVGTGHTASVSAVCISQLSSNFFLSASQDNTLKLWNINSVKAESENKKEYKLVVQHIEVAHKKEINTVALSPNDKLVATGSQDKTVKLWQREGLTLLGTLNGHRRGVWCVRFSPVDQIILSSSADCTIKLWSVADLNCLKTFEGHGSSVLRAEFINAGMQIVSTSGDGLVKLWTIKTGECQGTFSEHEDRIWAMAVSANEQTVITGGADSLLIFWRDSTQEKREEAAKAQEEILAKEQLLSNLITNNKLFAALGLALSLNKPFKVLSIIKVLIGKGKKEDLKNTIKKLTDSDKQSLLDCAAVWNSNSKNCSTAQLVISILLDEIACGELKFMKLPKFVEEVLPYTERHFKRLTNQLEELHLLEYTIATMKPELQLRD